MSEYTIRGTESYTSTGAFLSRILGNRNLRADALWRVDRVGGQSALFFGEASTFHV
jgi:hypothetical protein